MNNLSAIVQRATSLHHNIASDVWPDGFVLTCRTCGRRIRRVAADGAHYLRHGWPKCCGQPMFLQTAGAHAAIDSLSETSEMTMTVRSVRDLFVVSKRRVGQLARRDNWRSWKLRKGPCRGPRVYYSGIDVLMTYRDRKAR